VESIITLASQYGRYGYRRITAMLRNEGWEVNHKRVERIWRQEGLKVPKKQPKRRRLWLTDGSCIRLRPEKKDHVWSYDFVMIRTTDGRAVRILVIIDEYTRECLSLSAAESFRSQEVLPWENGYVESFYGKLRDELLNHEMFDTLFEDRILLEHGRWAYNGIQPHGFPGRRPPAPVACSVEKLTLGVVRTWESGHLDQIHYRS